MNEPIMQSSAAGQFEVAREIMAEAERRRVLVEFNSKERDYPREVTLHELFESQVNRTPKAPAAFFENEQLTYRQLNDRANALARRLRHLGVRSSSPVGVCLERSLDLPVTLLGVLKAGGGYVALDPGDPADRLSFALEDSQVPVIVTTEELAKSLPLRKAKTVCVDAEPSPDVSAGEATLMPLAVSTDLAYVLYTSGSTGRPKGVMISHRAVVNRLFGMQEDYRLTPRDVVLQKTPFNFDVSVWELFWTLMAGASMVIAKPQGHKDPDYLIDLIRRHGVTTLHFVPPALEVFLHHPQVTSCASIKRVFCGGESLSYKTQQRFFQHLDAELHYMYGTTESTIDVTSWVCQRHSHLDTVPIGRPLQNVRIYILDEQMNPMPIGAPGELYVGGVQVAIGYLNRPDLTRERFIPDPFSCEAGERLYRTGDLCRWRRDGNIEFLGRLDHQVKVRGLRIELGEVEVGLSKHPAVQQVVVAAHEEEAGSKGLVAYIVTANGLIPTVESLTHFLCGKLPDYMVPSAFVFLDTLPLTPNGKVDRQALPPPTSCQPNLERTFVAPRTCTEEMLAKIWCQALRLDHIGINDNFLDLGAHSLLMTQVVNRVRETFQVHLPISALFEAPTVSSLAVRIEGSANMRQGTSSAPIRQLNRNWPQ